MKKVRFYFLLCILLLTLCACSTTKKCEHTWIDATCATPKTCSLCGVVEGSISDHNWMDATCTTPKTCSVCSATEGVANSHIWVDATCTTPKTCSLCKGTEGNSLGHSYSEWEIKVKASVSSDGSRIRHCSVCQNSESESYQLSSYVQNQKFIFTPKEYRQLFFDNFVELGYSKFGGAQVKTNKDQVVVSIVDSSYNNVGNIGFVVNGSTLKMATSSTQSGFDGVVMLISANTEFVANAMQCLIMSCDPTVSAGISKIVASSAIKEKYEFGGITYSFAITDDYYMMTAVVSK